MQHFTLERGGRVYVEETTKPSRLYLGGGGGAVGPMAEGGITECDWPTVWQGVVVDLWTVKDNRWYPSSRATAFIAGIELYRA